jgi:hypothetical protein
VTFTFTHLYVQFSVLKYRSRISLPFTVLWFNILQHESEIKVHFFPPPPPGHAHHIKRSFALFKISEASSPSPSDKSSQGKGKGKVRVHPRTGHEGPEGGVEL